MSARIASAWNRLFHAPEAALNLAAARVIISAHALWVLLSRDLPAHSALPPEFWLNVDGGKLLRFLIFPGHPEIEYALQAAAMVALFTATIGVMPRLSCFISALLLYHLAPLETIYWTANPYQRGFTVSVLALFTLSFSPCGDALRLGRSVARDLSPIYCWPLRLVQFFLASAYLYSGAAKLIRVGVEWMSPDNLRAWFLLFSQQDQVRRLEPVYNFLGPWIAEHWILCLVAAFFGVVNNLLFVSVPFSRYARWILVPDAVFFHIIVLLTLSIFWINMPQLLIFVNWHWLAGRIARATAPGGGGPHVRAERHR